MSNVVIVAEKPSVANMLKKGLENKVTLITSVSGHLYTLAYKKYDKTPWAKVKITDLLKDEFKFIFSSTKAGINLNKIVALGVIDQLILACDPDVEGAFIESQILKYLESKSVKIRKRSSMILESLSPRDVVTAYEKRIPYNSIKAYPGELRSRLDFLFGTVLTRKASMDYLKTTKKWKTLNTGRVQTPTLQFIVNRENEIRNFVQKDYYEAFIKIPTLEQKLSLGTFESKESAQEIFIKISHIEISDATPVVHRPKDGLNTDKFLKLLSSQVAELRKVSVGAKVLNAMYLAGKITYPRTENYSYRNYRDLLNHTAKLYQKEFQIEPDLEFLKTFYSTKKTTDHGPISPLILSSEAETDLERKVLICLYNYLKKVFSGSNYYDSYDITLRIGSEDTKFTILKEKLINYESYSTSSKTFDLELARTKPYECII